jgi:hypothetical protein
MFDLTCYKNNKSSDAHCLLRKTMRVIKTISVIMEYWLRCAVPNNFQIPLYIWLIWFFWKLFSAFEYKIRVMLSANDVTNFGECVTFTGWIYRPLYHMIKTINQGETLTAARIDNYKESIACRKNKSNHCFSQH